MTSAELLEGCRERWDRPASKLAQMQARLTRHRDFNADCAGDNIPPHLIAPYRLLLESGTVVWAAVIFGEDREPEAGTDYRAAPAVYGLSQHFDRRPDALEDAAGNLYALSRSGEPEHGDPDRRAFAELLRSGADPESRPLPLSLAGGHSGAHLVSLVLHRRRLPTGRLDRFVLPIVVAPDKTPQAMVLPLRYWAPDLTRLWREEASAQGRGAVRVSLDDLLSEGKPASGDADASAPPPPPADPRARYEAGPLRVTPEAIEQFVRRLRRENLSPDRALMAVWARPGASAEAAPEFRVSVALNARVMPGDVVTEAGGEGVRVLAPADSLGLLAGRVVDWRPDRPGGFVVRLPGE